MKLQKIFLTAILFGICGCTSLLDKTKQESNRIVQESFRSTGEKKQELLRIIQELKQSMQARKQENLVLLMTLQQKWPGYKSRLTPVLRKVEQLHAENDRIANSLVELMVSAIEEIATHEFAIDSEVQELIEKIKMQEVTKQE